MWLRIFLSILAIFLNLSVYSQGTLVIEGTVHGYRAEPSKGILKRSKTPVLHGTLDKASVLLKYNSRVVARKNTGELGTYSLTLKLDRLYIIEVKREGYSPYSIYIDTRAMPYQIQKNGFRFINLEFILNSFLEENQQENLSRLYYNPGLQSFQIDYYSGRSDSEIDPPKELLLRAVEKNNSRLSKSVGYISHKKDQDNNKPALRIAAKSDSIDSASVAKAIQEERRLTISTTFSDLTPTSGENIENINAREQNIRRAKEQLAMDKLLSRTRYDSLTILQREAQIFYAEKEIETSKALINEQDTALKAQRTNLLLLSILLVIALGVLLLLFLYFKQRQRSAYVVELKNRQITDSLSYAKRIQQSVFTDEALMKVHLPESFVLNLPRDIVGGDFFFFHKCGNSYLVGVADCTGHGVPGAFMSLIGNRLLREIIVEREIQDPAEILKELDTGIRKSFSGQNANEVIEDGMDMAICQIHPDSRTITFAAAMNPAYLISDREIQVLQADIASVGGQVIRKRRKPQNKSFTNKAVRYDPDSTLYLFSDGFMDQFGELEDEKFNTRRFKEMILDNQHKSAHDQRLISLDTIKNWQGSVQQTDDIMLVGIKLP